MVFGLGEDFSAGFEVYFSPGPIRIADHCQRSCWHAHMVFLLMDLAIAVDGNRQGFGKCVHHGHADPVEAAGDLVGIVIKLTASMQHRHDHLGRRYPLIRVHIHGDATPVIIDRDRVIAMQDNVDFIAMACQRLIDGIIDHLEHHVMQSGAIIGVTDIHTGTLAHRIKPFQNLDIR